jgi:hypothetical protein
VNKKNAIASGIVAKTDAERIPAEIRFSIDEQALTREQVMMLDILANNDWKRPIYFSSPGGSNVSIALYQRGFVKQNGIAYEFTPVVDRNPIDKEKMYKNLTKVYDFGKMNKKGVLTDYYTRRHTSQYRDQFIRLAEAYLNEADELKNGKVQFPGQISELRGAGQSKTADSLQNILKNADNTIADKKKRRLRVLLKFWGVDKASWTPKFKKPGSCCAYTVTGTSTNNPTKIQNNRFILAYPRPLFLLH